MSQHDEGKARTYTRMTKHTARIGRMLDDPECTGDLLLLGIALARLIDLDRWGDTKEDRAFRTIAARIWGPERLDWKVQHIIRKDVRRYEVVWHTEGRCEAPMLRREGPCDRPGSHLRLFVDPDTGEKTKRHACNRSEHRGWLDQKWRENASEVKADGIPVPPANAGGVLARHIPEVDWEDLYKQVQPGWTPPPETKAWKKPTLRLVLGGAS